jgi:acyl carrier protein
MMTELEILCEYIRKEIGYQGQLLPDVDLLEAHILDSFNVVQLAIFIQDHFKIEFEAEDLVRTNLATLGGMVALIGRRRVTNGQQ